MKKKLLIVFSLLINGLFITYVEAGQVTMASYDFDSDYIEEIIRTDEKEGMTVVRIYKRIEDSFFYKPFQSFDISGRLVQVPEIVDVNSDGMKDYFFATGSDMGVIYYDVPSKEFKRTNNFDFEITWPDEAESTKEEVASYADDQNRGESISLMIENEESKPPKRIQEADLSTVPKSDEGSIL